MTAALSTRRYARLVPALLVAATLAAPAWAQTKVVAPNNSYSIQEDVKLGQEAAQEVRRELPMLEDDRVDDYVEDVGRRLVAAIPPEFSHAGFRYTFDVVNQKEINAFALPGGPMFLNRGMIEAAKSEGEMAGVMAHEISHVALRHGTAQATKSQPWAIGSAVGQILGGILGGGLGQVVATGSQIIPGLKLMQYSRDYERQADVLGAQILARAGYDPREMANMFRTIEAEGGGGGPEWLSSHPNPGNRYDAIIAESKSLRIQGNANTGDFRSIQARLNGMSPALTAEQIARGQGGNRPTSTASRTVRVDPPSASFRTHQPANFLRVSVPSNWQPVNGSSTGVTYTPEGAFFREGNATAFTHGVQIGVVQGSGNLARDTQQILNGFAQSNPELRQEGQPRRDTVGGRNGLTTFLTNTSEVTGARERIAFSTTQLRDGSVLFIVGVAPQNEANSYDNAFRRVRQSVQISDNR
jgi:Zn-dependent protease with chaperone function